MKIFLEGSLGSQKFCLLRNDESSWKERKLLNVKVDSKLSEKHAECITDEM